MIALKKNKSVKSWSYEEAYVRVQKTNKTNLKASDISKGLYELFLLTFS